MAFESIELVCRDISNLFALPQKGYAPPQKGASFSAGDTHGNAIALLRYFYEAGIINTTQEEYTSLIKLYSIDSQIKNASQLTPEYCALFRKYVRSAFERADVPSGVNLRSFGDMLADRGSNDILSLIILVELRRRFPELRGTILISNHDKCFVRNYLTGALRPGGTLVRELSPCDSLVRLKWLIDNHIVDYQEVDEMIKTAYLPALKFVDYVRTNDGGIDIMAHAPLPSLDTIENAMQQWLSPDKHRDIYASVDNMAQVLDDLNIVFRAGLEDSSSAIYQALTTPPSPSNPLYGFIWPRLADVVPSARQPTYKHRIRHGHDGSPGEKIIHGVSYIGYNSIFGKATPRQWQMVDIANLSMSVYGGAKEEDKFEAVSEALTAQIKPTEILSIEETVVEEEKDLVSLNTSTSVNSIDTEPSSSEENPLSTENVEQALMLFQSAAMLCINQYINSRGSYSNTEVGDKLWTGIASTRNMVRTFFKVSLVDVPQVPLATELKHQIIGLHVSNVSGSLPYIKKAIADSQNLTESSEYIKLSEAIGAALQSSGLSKGDEPLSLQQKNHS